MGFSIGEGVGFDFGMRGYSILDFRRTWGIYGNSKDRPTRKLRGQASSCRFIEITPFVIKIVFSKNCFEKPDVYCTRMYFLSLIPKPKITSETTLGVDYLYYFFGKLKVADKHSIANIPFFYLATDM